MERAVAVKKLSKMLGKSFGYRVNADAPDAEERAQAREEAKILSAEHDAADKAAAARRRAILEGDAEYQRLFAEAKRLKEAWGKTSSKVHHFKITVGQSSGMFFRVKAQGDTWESIIKTLNGGSK